MRSCSRCSGFVPRHLTACPHCDAAPSRWHRLGRAVIGLVGASATAITLAACYGAPPSHDTCVDRDGDGWLPGCYNHDRSCDPDDEQCDCDDDAGWINPGAIDLVGDGVDRDCDGKDGQRPGGPLPDPTWPDQDAGAEPDGREHPDLDAAYDL